MYEITIKYKGSGCYRFIDELENIIYVGSAKNIHTRLNQHFSKKGSNVGKEAYKSTAIVEIIKTDDYATALALEQYLINKYKPKYNKRDKSHNINSRVVKNSEYYEKLEKWQLYYKLKNLDKEKIDTNKRQDRALLVITYAMLILIIIKWLI